MSDVHGPAEFALTWHLEGAVATIEVAGDLDVHTARALEDLGARLFFEEQAQSLVIECAKVTHLDSSGLRVLIELRRVGQERSGTTVIRHPSKAVRRPIELAALGLMIDEAGSADG